jgi:hypothetical protein
MATRRSTEARLEQFLRACESAGGDGLDALVRDALRDRHCRIVAKAAGMAAEHALYALEDEQIAAYRRLLSDPIKRDPHCIAKGAIVRALVTLDCQDVDFFLAAMRYRQPEPVWGGTTDTATDVRVAAAMGLVGTSYHRAAVAIAELLTDDEAPVRIGAVRAMTAIPDDRAEPLLRLKALCGDGEAEVVGECFSALLQISPDESVGFVAAFLDRPDTTLAQLAALALGESRDALALRFLAKAFDQPYVDRDFRRILIRAVVLQRTEPAYDCLLQAVRERDAAACRLVIQELALYRDNARLAERLAAAIRDRDDGELMQLFDEEWRTSGK